MSLLLPMVTPGGTPGYADHLLPPNASPLMQTVAGAQASVQRIPVPIDTIKTPQKTPQDFLPFLGWERSVDIWNNDWDDQTKRNVIAASIPLHFRKGTAYAIERYVRYVGGQVIGWTKPPSKIFSGPSLTRAEREAWLASLPQVRTYFFRDTGMAGLKCFFSSPWARLAKSRNFFLEGRFAIPSQATQHLARHATWNVNGVDTATTVEDFGSYFRLHLTGQAGLRLFTSTPSNAHRFFVPSDAWRRLVTIEPQNVTPWRIAIGPSLQAVTAQPELVAQPGQRGLSVYTGSNLKHGTGSLMSHGNFFIPSTSKYRLFERYAVYDGTVGLKRPNTQFMGVGRYGFPSHTAIMQVSVPGKRMAWAADDRGIFIPKTRFWVPHDRKPMELVRWATQAAMRLSDKILIQSGPIAQFVAGKPFQAGADTYVVGRPAA
jgi:phage tail P2-like protein